MSQSVTNKLIANIKQSSINNTNNFINKEDVICIDSYNNRIGINTRNPLHSIEISGNNIRHGIKCSYLDISFTANINEINTHTISFENLVSGNLMDISQINFNLITGNRIDVSKINISDLSLINIDISNNLIANEISCKKIVINSDQECVINKLTVNELTANRDEQENIRVGNLEVRTDLSSSKIYTRDISFVDGSGNKLKLNNLNIRDISAQEISSNKLTIIGETMLSDISVSGVATFDSSINVSENMLKIGNKTFEQTVLEKTQDLLQGNNTNINANFGTIHADYATITNSAHIYNLNINDTLTLPIHNTGGNVSFSPRSMFFNDQNKSIIIYSNNNQENEFKSIDNKFLNIELSNNDYTKIRENYGIYTISGDNITDYIVTKNNENYRFFDIKIKDISINTNLGERNTNNKYIEVSNNIINFKDIFETNSNNILQINANISLRLINKNRNDVELSNYEFGIYPISTNEGGNTNITSIKNHFGSFTDDISDIPLTSIKNSIMVYDLSFNYANSSLSYIYKNKTNQKLYGIIFLIKSVEDCCLNNLIVDSFNATISIT